MNRLFINGRFLTRPLTGVERFAFEMIKAMEAVLSNCGRDPEKELCLILPQRAKMNAAAGFQSKILRSGRLPGQCWEQLELPIISRNGWLYNPCNLGPIVTRRSIVTIHDAQIYLSPESYSRSFRLLYKTLLPILGRRAKSVTTVSSFSRSMLEHYGVVPPGKIQVIPGACDHMHRIAADNQILNKHGLNAKSYFLSVGSRSSHKNINMVIDATSRRQDHNHPLVIAGGSVNRVFSDGGLADSQNVIHLGRVTEAELKALYENALCFVFPSFFEGFGLPPLEAMACGCPVIASNTSAIPEVCAEAVLYADPTIPQAWADRMDQVSSQIDLRERLKKAGKIRADLFTWANTAAMFLRLVALEDGDTELGEELGQLISHEYKSSTTPSDSDNNGASNE